jgi:hypothetical protein
MLAGITYVIADRKKSGQLLTKQQNPAGKDHMQGFKFLEEIIFLISTL